MGGGSPMQTVLSAPGVNDGKVVSFTLDAATDEKDTVAGLIRSIIATSSPAQRTAFHVFHINTVVDLFSAWRRTLPDVRPYYAVKCNPDPALDPGRAGRAGRRAVLALGVGVGGIPPGANRSNVYANPCKAEPHLEYAAEAGVALATYDTESEVAKVARCHPRCELLLRLKGPDGGTTGGDLMNKYGAHAHEVSPLLRAAQRAGVAVAGVSFHVGSPVSRVDVYRGATNSARAAFDAAVALGMPPMRVLDIGGGFRAGAAFDEAAAVINDALADVFGDLLPCVEVIAEPGRYFAETAFTLAARVIGKRVRGEARECWIDDGLYGSLNNVLMDHKVPRPRPLAGACPGEKTYASTVFGPTCDSRDLVVTGYQLPEMCVGDWLVFDNMGAYSTGAGSKFNGFDISEMKIYVAYSS
ncbi:unnamed protein product [Miscanthus lutarioriparius]|uniref:Orn/DAP/Arg decarboxylase 2 N-terminal domain-containing protein n=1 Tax=Miscanthus lutarioriparius TaxID=422564 RepID=A0A811QKG6_9POAL|nr:unnamed protein product [Miscanthus lutarioriparius]